MTKIDPLKAPLISDTKKVKWQQCDNATVKMTDLEYLISSDRESDEVLLQFWKRKQANKNLILSVTVF